MKIVYAAQELPVQIHHKSIFLAGPTPRSEEVQSWRGAAIDMLKTKGFDGHVVIPEADGGGWHGKYDEQVIWEWEALGKAACTIFWVPRNLETMPGFTTNVEFGFMAAAVPDRVVLGFPEGTPKTRYLQFIAEHPTEFSGRLNLPTSARIPVASTLEEAVEFAIQRVS